MIQTTRGIVFHTTRYSETSAIVKIFTEESGLMSFLVKGLYSKKSKDPFRNVRASYIT